MLVKNVLEIEISVAIIEIAEGSSGSSEGSDNDSDSSGRSSGSSGGNTWNESTMDLSPFASGIHMFPPRKGTGPHMLSGMLNDPTMLLKLSKGEGEDAEDGERAGQEKALSREPLLLFPVKEDPLADAPIPALLLPLSLLPPLIPVDACELGSSPSVQEL